MSFNYSSVTYASGIILFSGQGYREHILF